MRTSRSLGAALLAALLAGCGGPAPSPKPASPSPIAEPTASTAVTVDPTLLDVLPPEVEGAPFEPVPEAATEVAADPRIGRHAVGVAVGMVVDAGADGEDFAVASVVELRDGVVDEAFLRDWRESYDEGACAQAGGVTRRAEVEIGGRRTFIGTCAGGVRTYHVHLAGPDRIVSITAIGERRFGERLVSGIAAGSERAAGQP